MLLPKSALQCQRLRDLFFDETCDNKSSAESLGLTQVHSKPNIYVMEDFLSPADLEFLQEQINKGGFRRSFVDKIAKSNEQQSIEYDAEHRTSTFMSFQKRQHNRIAAMERKACTLLGVWNNDAVEPLQLVRYRKNEFFGTHHDLGDLDEKTGDVSLPPRNPFSKRRIATLFCYLNDVPEGGDTYFPECDLSVQPKRGSAVLFSNVKLSDGGDFLVPDERTVHEGRPCLKGLKYGLNIWVCED